MRRKVYIILGIALVLGVGLFALYKYNIKQTKSHSPETTVSYIAGDVEIEVFYNRPYKKGRVIFGELVPFNEVWRTGANEATTFETNSNITVNGQELPAGKYTLWTIPGPDKWTVIFNSKQYPWGVKFNGEPSRNPKYDVASVISKAQNLERSVEQFTISFEESRGTAMVLSWDQTRVEVDLSR